jgi:hypothetical protein
MLAVAQREAASCRNGGFSVKLQEPSGGNSGGDEEIEDEREGKRKMLELVECQLEEVTMDRHKPIESQDGVHLDK